MCKSKSQCNMLTFILVKDQAIVLFVIGNVIVEAHAVLMNHW